MLYKNSNFEQSRFFFQRTGFHSNRTGLPVKPVETDWTGVYSLKFEFDWFLPISGQTGPVYWNRRLAVSGDRSVKKKTLNGSKKRDSRSLYSWCSGWHVSSIEHVAFKFWHAPQLLTERQTDPGNIQTSKQKDPGIPAAVEMREIYPDLFGSF